MPKRILVIEDNTEVRENIAEILELSGYQVATADNGKTGVETALSAPFDLVVCDIMMPQLDGYGVLHLLGKHKETRDVPFIFLTAKSERADLRKGMEMGADDYLTKPFDGIELLKAVEMRLKKAEAAPVPLLSNDREIQDYKKKHALYTEGQKPKAAYHILSGKIKVFKTNDDGKELITNILGQGDFLGYRSILEGSSYRDNAEILEDASLMMIPADDFLDLITRDTKVAGQFIRLISRNVTEKEEDLLNLAYNSLRKKVAYGITQLISKFKEPGKEPVVLTLTRKDLAQAIGVATESLIRTMADFKEEKLIDIQDSRIVILDEHKLRNLPY